MYVKLLEVKVPDIGEILDDYLLMLIYWSALLLKRGDKTFWLDNSINL